MSDITPLKADVTASSEETQPKSKGPYPPYNCPYIWAKKFFDLPKQMGIVLVDKNFVSSTIIGNGNESKVINALKFLQLIDEDCKVTAKVSLLNSEGEDFKKNLRKIVEEGYSDLLKNVKVEQADPSLVHGYFTNPSHWGMTLAHAKNATKFFVSLASDAGLPLSPKLSAVREKIERQPRERKQPSQREGETKPKASSAAAVLPPISTVARSGQVPSANVQATISMSLDKDTPLEIWKMAMKLLGLSEKEGPNN